MPRKGRTSARRRRGDREKEEKREGTAAASRESTCGRDDARGRRGGCPRPKKTYYREYPPRIPETAAFKSPKEILLTVTSIQRTERPGDARPPENRGHVTDPPHPDPCKQERHRYSMADLSPGGYLSSSSRVNLEQRFPPEDV